MSISIIIVTYNSGKKLKNTLDSILSQDFFKPEIVIIDGASTDETVQIIKDYEKIFDGNLKWISEKDSGIYNAMNKGIRMAKGDFLNFIGAGDWLENGALEKVAGCIEKNPKTDAVYGKTKVWDADLKRFEMMQTLPEILPVQTMQHNAIFYRKDLHEEFGLYNEKYKICSDYDFLLKAFHKGKKNISILDQAIVNFVKDGISSKRKYLCIFENAIIRKRAGIGNGLLVEFISQLKGKIKRLCQK